MATRTAKKVSGGSTSPLEEPTSHGRPPKQQRSAQRQRLITDAAISVIAEHGLAGVTHRLVADTGGISLAATTYHYKTKSDIIAAASAQLLASYVDTFNKSADRYRGQAQLTFREFVIKVVANATGRHRRGTLAWCEIILDGARREDTRALARTWFIRLLEVWRQIAQILGADEPELAARSAIDVVIGLLLMVVPLGLKESQVIAVLGDGADPSEVWKPRGADDSTPLLAEEDPTRKLRKAHITRERILSAAIDLLVAEGAAGVTHRAVARHAGVVPTAAMYYYPSIESLLQAAQVRLFANSKCRYRLVMSGVDPGNMDVERLSDLTATVFVREATEFGRVSLADYPVRLEAARHPSLRPTVWSVVVDQQRAWSRLLRPLTARDRPLDALLMQSLFVGKLVRILAIGATTLDLSAMRGEFHQDLQAIAHGHHWATVPEKLVRKFKKVLTRKSSTN
jgi:DNA-binding transcriptional regulator YbjK